MMKMEPILTGLEVNIAKAMTQQDSEVELMGKVLDHGAGKGYCFLMSLLYGLEEVGGNNLREMIMVLKGKVLRSEVFDKGDGFVGNAWELAKVVTYGNQALQLITKTDNIDVVRNVIYNATPRDKLFLVAKLPGHYIYVRLTGDYSNPNDNKDVDEKRILGWRLWKVVV